MISYRTVCTAGRGATMQTISTQTNTDVRYIDKQSIHISWPPSVRTLDGSQLFPSTQSRSSTDFHEPSLWLCFQKVVLRYPEIWSFLIASQCIPMLAVHFPLRCRWNPHWNPSTPDRLQIDSRSTPGLHTQTAVSKLSEALGLAGLAGLAAVSSNWNRCVRGNLHLGTRFTQLRWQKTWFLHGVYRLPVFNGCLRHAADTPPLERLLMSRCAIYDPVEGFQIWKRYLRKLGFRIWIPALFNILHMLSYGHRGVGGCDNVLDEYYTWPTELVAVVNMLHMLSYGHQGGGRVW